MTGADWSEYVEHLEAIVEGRTDWNVDEELAMLNRLTHTLQRYEESLRRSGYLIGEARVKLAGKRDAAHPNAVRLADDNLRQALSTIEEVGEMT